jgi:hypothetical protein
MKRSGLLALLTLIVIGLCSFYYIGIGQIRGSNTMTTSNFDLNNFTEIDISHAVDLKIVQAKSFRVEITHNDNLGDYLLVETKGDRLRIGLKKGHSYKNTTVKALVHLPTISDLEASGASKISFEEITATELYTDLSGASELYGNLEVENFDLDVSGASSIKLEGTAQKMDLESSGAASINSKDFIITQELKLEASGASSILLQCDGKMFLELSGASSFVNYGKGVAEKKELSGASSFKSKML